MRIRILLLASLLASMLAQPLRATAQGLSATGPWIVYLSASNMAELNDPSSPYRSTDRLVAANPDGSGATILAEGQIYTQLTPTRNGLLAYLSYDKGNSFYTNLTLNVIQLPTGQLIRAIPLVSADIAAKIASGDPAATYSIRSGRSRLPATAVDKTALVGRWMVRRWHSSAHRMVPPPIYTLTHPPAIPSCALPMVLRRGFAPRGRPMVATSSTWQ
ncbi:MAG: hypothetical protein U0528_09470 [Anaerolineae bacterium]